MQNKENKKKITLVGPPNSGKTTIVRVFFEMVNPIKILEESVDPSKGLNSNMFSLFDDKLGIFDLAGQENDNWFTRDSEVFSGSDLIICIFDITTSLDSILRFLINIINLKKRLNLDFCKIIIFLHKRDLVIIQYPNITSSFIKTQLKNRGVAEQELSIYPTSITKDYFFLTYSVIFELLNFIKRIDMNILSNTEINQLNTELSIILKCNNSIKYNKKYIAKDFNLDESEMLIHLNRLENLGFISSPISDPYSFFLTNRAYWFKIGLESKEEKTHDNKSNEGIEILHAFLNINRESSKA